MKKIVELGQPGSFSVDVLDGALRATHYNSQTAGAVSIADGLRNKLEAKWRAFYTVSLC
jgi:hypothetical protein